MKRLMALVLLTACSAPDQDPRVAPGMLRNPTAPIASQADVTQARLSASWIVRQQFVGAPAPLGSTLTLAPAGPAGDLRLQATGANCAACPVTETLLKTGPGRWRAAGDTQFPTDELWALWMDGDNRTVAIGTPTGRFAWIMDRQAEGGADRIASARDILDWYGFDIEQLEPVR